jgi:murein DD-endopeptidase / murein LD-carboxypeptidase
LHLEKELNFKKLKDMNLKQNSTLLVIILTLASCSTFKPAARTNQLTSNYTTENGNTKSSIKFLNVKAVEDNKTTTKQASTSSNNNFDVTKINTTPTTTNQNYSTIQLKYATKLNVDASAISNVLLYQNIESWYGTRYVFGGTTHRGVDCSSLMQHLYKSTYKLEIPRTAVTQYRATQRITQDELKEGDLIFFHTTRSGISHVGFYLGNRYFVHASSSRGVVISNLDESYYAKAYRGAGRFTNSYKATQEELEAKEEETK